MKVVDFVKVLNKEIKDLIRNNIEINLRGI